jgi:hypothetical protein
MKKCFDIHERQFAAIKKRLAGGRTLTAAQMRFVEQYNTSKVETPRADSASGVTDLARRLGVNRQVINWHRGRLEAPKDFSIPAWREYLLTHGRGSTIDRVSDCSPGHDAARIRTEDATLAQFHAVSNELEKSIRFAMASEGVTLPDKQIDRIVFATWLLLAGAQQSVAEHQNLDGIFDTDENDRMEYPSAIVSILSRIDQNQKPTETK